MGRVVTIDPELSAHAHFAYELRRQRTLAGLTLAQLGRRIGFSASLVGMVETMRRIPVQEFAELCDRALGQNGALIRLYLDAWPPPPPVPEHYRDWAAAEQRATAIHSWNPLLIPGLLQTESYARMIFNHAPGISKDEIEERLAGRMQQKAVFGRDDPPTVTAVINERVLHRGIGGSTVMREQLEYLLEIANNPLVTIQIVPDSLGICGLQGAFSIAEKDSAPYTVHMEAQPNGRTSSDRAVIAKIVSRYDAIRADAYPRHMSLDVIKDVRRQWT